MVVKNTRGVTDWKCIIDDSNIGSVEFCLSVQTGDITECQIIEPAYKYKLDLKIHR